MSTARTAPQPGSLIATAVTVVARFDRLLDAWDRRLAERRTWLAACALVLVLQLALIVAHEPWRDEWQALQIAVQSPTLSDLFVNLGYEGHPPLWYLLLRAVAATAGAGAALAIAVGLAAIAGQAAVLALAPFARSERLLLASGEMLLFEYFAISRSLSLGVALLLTAVALWRSRWAWLPIALLPLCDFQFGVLSAGLVLLRWRDGDRWPPAIAAWLACGIVAAWSVVPAPDMAAPGHRLALVDGTVGFVRNLGPLLLPLQWDGGLRWDAPLPPLLGGIGAVGFAVFAWVQTRHDALHRALLFGFVAICWLFSITVYGLSVRHVMLIAVALVALRWLAPEGGERRSWRLWLAGGAVCGLLAATVEFAGPFDRGGDVAREIARRGLTRARWMAFPGEYGQGVAALTGIGFERPERPCWQQFVRWNEAARIDRPAQLEAVLVAAVARNGRFYLLSRELLAFSSVPMRELARFAPGYDGQGYVLYEIAPGARAKAAPLPPCVARQQALGAVAGPGARVEPGI